MFFVVIILSLAGLGFGISVDEAMRLALERNLQLKAMEERAGIFEGLEKSALAFGNPEINFESGFLTTSRGGGPRERFLNLLELSQPIPLWGTRQKGASVVNKQREAFMEEYESLKREILGDVYRRFYEALYRKEVVKVWKESLRTARELEEFIESSYRLGDTTELEVFRVKRERGLAEVRLKVAEANYEGSLKELSALLNTEVESVEGELKSLKDVSDFSVEKLPQVKRFKKLIESLDRQIELEKALAKPSLSAGVIVEDSESGYYGLRAVISTEVPLLYRRQGEILQSVYRKQSLAREMDAVELELRKRLESIKLRYKALVKELDRFERELIPQAGKELELAVKSYRLRAITLLELSDVRNRYYELLISRAELLREIHNIYAEFVSIGGWK